MIDGGPLRTSRPAGRQVAYRNESIRHQPEEQYAEPVAPPEPSRQPQQYRHAETERSIPVRTQRDFGWVKWVVGLCAVVLLAIGAWLLWPKDQGLATTIDSTKHQAVFLSNGQVYFGRLSLVDSHYMKLTDVYYLERQLTANDTPETNPQTTGNSAADNNFQLLKYSDVLYGSEDAMIISRDDIIRYENLRSDGVVARAIANRR